MRQYKELLSRMVASQDLAAEVLPGQSLVELYGMQRVLVEHHFGVVQYKSTEIYIKVHDGQICVCGNNLELTRMTKEQLVITGDICDISICKRGQ